ncbi:glycoside hydrolase family 68 protein [Niallia sp. 01092]|uniref:glycoside hydrolase family 68 protein n=1 Tax=unclassified Niallia TaxID=2837522 RepID=UPI003FD3A830
MPKPSKLLVTLIFVLGLFLLTPKTLILANEIKRSNTNANFATKNLITVYTSRNTNLKSDPRINSKTIKKLNKQTTLKLVSNKSSKGFKEVVYNNTKGYIESKHISDYKVEKVTKNQPIKYKSIIKYDSQMPTTYKENTQKGSNGIKEITYENKYKNGKELYKLKYISEKTIRQKINKITVVGKKPVPLYVNNLQSYITRDHVANYKYNTDNIVPSHNGSDLKNFPKDNNGVALHVWDSWPLMTEDGKVASIGKSKWKVIFGLTTPYNDRTGASKIAYYYTNSDSDFSTWKFGGYVIPEDKRIIDSTKGIGSGSREWSGSSIIDQKGNLHLFYTVSDRGQDIATAIMPIKDTGDKLVIAPPTFNEIIMSPDGYYYQTQEQANERASETNAPQNFTFRDPHFFQDPKTKKNYLVFEGNTGNGNDDREGLVFRDYYGEQKLYEKDYKQLSNMEKNTNGALGIVELTNKEYTKVKYMEPLLTSNLITDEIERANIIYNNGRYYLFTTTHGANMFIGTGRDGDLINDTLFNNEFKSKMDLSGREFMLGYTATSLFGEYEPLNGNGLVLTTKVNDSINYSYSWLVLPNLNVISYARFSVPTDDPNSPHLATAAPSLKLHINGKRTKVDPKLLDQSQLIDDTIKK